MYYSSHDVETQMDFEDEVAGNRATTEDITRGVYIPDRLTEVNPDDALVYLGEP